MDAGRNDEGEPPLPADPLPLIAYLRGEISTDELPSQLHLPEELWQQMDELWQRSIADIDRGVVREWGGVLVLDPQGQLRLTNVVAGTSGQVGIAFTPVHGTIVGSFHTHPYADGTTGVGFSGQDIADTINGGELLSLLQSGLEVFALLRTEHTPMRVDAAHVKEQHNRLLHHYVIQEGMGVMRAVRYTNAMLCEHYGLAYYYGVTYDVLEEVYKP